MTRSKAHGVLTVVTALVLAACGAEAPGAPSEGSDALGEATSPDASPSAPSRLTVGIGSYPDSFSPNNFRVATFTTGYRAMYDTLTEADPAQGGALVPALATEWELIDDTTWQFKLRDDVVWHDGTAFTADDVVATIDFLLTSDPPPAYGFRIASVVGTEKIDAFTVNLLTNSLDALLPVGLADVYIHQGQQIAEGGNDAINANPIGTGRFRYSEREEGVSVTLVKNPDYWRPVAQFDELVFRAIPEDGTRIAAVERGEIDIAFNVPPDSASNLEANEDISIVSAPIGFTMVLQLRTTGIEPLKDVRVRQALNYAVDKNSLRENILLDFAGPPAGQLVGPDGFGHAPSVEPYPYDPERAKELLAEAGYPDGFAMTLNTAQGRFVKQLEMSEAIAGQLREVGIDVTVKLWEWGALVAEGPKIDVYYTGWGYQPVMDGEFALQQYACDGRFVLHCSEQFDALWEAERSNVNPEEREEIMQEMAELLHEEAPVVFLFQAADIFAVRDSVHGFVPSADNLIHMDEISVSP